MIGEWKLRTADFDIVIVGGGHAGVEAALVASRMGRQVAIVSMDKSKLALMSCNPAVGGVGKSQLVTEIDALGGLIGEAADATGIQFRRLNLSRGPAVWSTRIQVDRIAYNRFVVDRIKQDSRITIIEGLVGKIVTRDETAVGVVFEDGHEVAAKAIVVCSGTFLGGLIHIGEKQIQSGRMGEPGAYALTDSLKSLGFEIGRLKTGTPPRLDGDTIDLSQCTVQLGEAPAPLFSHRSRNRDLEQACCHLTYTTAHTKEIVSRNRTLSPMFSGQIHSTGPRYCPSIEDKFYRFADKDRHQIFLEPEGNGTNEIYPNGFSTALPEDVQREAIRTITGLSEVRLTQPGYAIEYDYCPAHQIRPTMETRRIARLYLAGQINGTSGYEEAAAQGLLAGINAVLSIEGESPFVPDRSEAYLGVMIDDLTTRSTTEPYRMFTSRAEYRLALREDNARDRLCKYAEQYSLVPAQESDVFRALQRETESCIESLKKKRVRVADLGEYGHRFQRTTNISLENLLKQPNVPLDSALDLLEKLDGDVSVNREVLKRATIFIRYSGYIDKQQREIDKFKKAEAVVIPDDFNYDEVPGLKTEARQKFIRYRPDSLGQASRIEGITPGDVAILSIFVFRQKEGT
ncbi:MAG: tRNA uridine-5-carboxymethylaminomethyl(34) synthesis enzyme MnmG [candidate division Zixibacteria bacterium]|nr:tRNA uridine-5-carboxymethylaminomethyl(34) synthesis enzyme MnmG [candidate division Zixibacteria bacterium]